MSKGEKAVDESVPGIDGTEEPDDQVRRKQLSGRQNPGCPAPAPRVVLYTSSHTLFRQSSGEETQTSWRLPGGGQGWEQKEVCLFLAVQYPSIHSHFCPDPNLNSPRASRLLPNQRAWGWEPSPGTLRPPSPQLPRGQA